MPAFGARKAGEDVDQKGPFQERLFLGFGFGALRTLRGLISEAEVGHWKNSPEELPDLRPVLTQS